jgi:hypothetical protein
MPRPKSVHFEGILCFVCRHLDHPDELEAPMTCSAFPDGIPLMVLDGDVDHTKPIDGDGGIQFEETES